MSFNLEIEQSQEALANYKADVISGSYQLPNSNIYKALIKLAYISQSKSGAYALNLKLDVFVEGMEKPLNHTETIYFTNSKKQNFFVSKEGKPILMPSFVVCNELCQIVTGKGITSQNQTETSVPLYNFELKKEIMTAVPLLTDLVSQPIYIGLLHKKDNKQALVNGTYVDTNEPREYVTIDKVFGDKNGVVLSLEEIKNNETEPKVAEKWLQANKDKVKGRYKEVAQDTPTYSTTAVII